MSIFYTKQKSKNYIQQYDQYPDSIKLEYMMERE